MTDFFQPVAPSRTKCGTAIPAVIYGTAQKSDASTIVSAIASGARGLDTACQPHNYDEEAVGAALQTAFKTQQDGGLGLSRAEIYIQSKFTPPRAHSTATMPYSSDDSIPIMVKKSLGLTLSKLQIQGVDALLLHAPMPSLRETLEVWRAMEDLVGQRVLALGVCNIGCAMLQRLHAEARVKPRVVQNRFWSENGYDRDVRSFCEKNGIVYQPFWIIRANARLLRSNLIGWLSQKTGTSAQDTLFLAVLSMSAGASGISILTGTQSSEKVSSLLDTVGKWGRMPPLFREAFLSELQGCIPKLTS